jgi:hypothetical protein
MKHEHRMEILKKPRTGKKMHQLCQEHCSHFKRKTMQKTLGNNPHFSCFSASSKRKETTDAFGPASNLSKNTMSEGSSCKEPISSGTN